jgi:hypothetical protein
MIYCLGNTRNIQYCRNSFFQYTVGQMHTSEPDGMEGQLHLLTHFVLRRADINRYYHYPYFVGEETGAQRC